MQTFQTVEEILEAKAGMIAVDKPVGVSSHTVVNWARKVFGVKRIGHTGTLDPLASGLLILLVSRSYTKLQDTYLKQDKEYRVTMRLGVVSDTYDSTGVLSEQMPVSEVLQITDENIRTALLSFVGESEQQVPVFSAVKRGGQKLYQLARSGEADTVELPTRLITIYSIDDIWTDRSDSQAVFVSFTVSCSSGTYVRSLVHDCGQKLGTGAVVTALRRTAIGDFLLSDAPICPNIPKRFYH